VANLLILIGIVFGAVEYPIFNYVGSWFDDERNIFGFAGYHDNIIYVSWRGTVPTDIPNWLGNFDMIPTSYAAALTGVRVHSGFLRSYRSLQTEAQAMIRAAKEACPLCTRVVLTGHSLGGALATLNSLDISNWLNIPTSSITLLSFSSPRVGNAAFASYYERTISDHWNVVNSCDLVPHVPYRFLGYTQISSEQWFDGVSWHTCTGREDPTCSNSCDFYNVLDHSKIMELDIPNGALAGCLLYTD